MRIRHHVNSLIRKYISLNCNRHRKYKVRPGVNELKITIPERAVLISTNPNDVVLDPFGGGGSTYQVCEQNGRRWIGIEKFDCSVIRERLENRIENGGTLQ